MYIHISDDQPAPGLMLRLRGQPLRDDIGSRLKGGKSCRAGSRAASCRLTITAADGLAVCKPAGFRAAGRRPFCEGARAAAACLAGIDRCSRVLSH